MSASVTATRTTRGVADRSLGGPSDEVIVDRELGALEPAASAQAENSDHRRHDDGRCDDGRLVAILERRFAMASAYIQLLMSMNGAQ